MKKVASICFVFCIALIVSAGSTGVSQANDPFVATLWEWDSGSLSTRSTEQGKACWGQASRVFARMGAMGQHASQEPTPRLGLRNLARALAEAGIIPDDSMQSLGRFFATELGLSIDACM